MSRMLSAVAVAIALIAATGCDRPNKPSLHPDSDAATLLPANVVQPVAGGEVAGNGFASLNFSVIRDPSGRITSATVDLQVALTGFPSSTAPTEAHVHRGDVGFEGVIVIDTGVAPGEVVMTTGSGGFIKQGINITPELATEMLSSPERFYVDVHTVLNPAGMVRGQLFRQ